MIVSHKHKFIFIKTAKTAGTSIEIALSKFCDQSDIITPLIKEDEEIRQNLGYQTACNFYLSFTKWGKREWLELLKNTKRPRFGAHCSAKYLKSKISDKKWNNYYKFCFERNPWDKAISLYYWQTRNNKNPPDFSSYLLNLKKNKLSNFNKYTQDDKLIVDDVFKYEDLAESLNIISEKLNLPINEYLIRTKHQYRKVKSKNAFIMSPSDIDLIWEWCEKEITMFGYEYENKT